MMPVRRFVFSRSTWGRSRKKMALPTSNFKENKIFKKGDCCGFPHLDPLWAVVVSRRPCISLPHLIQPGKLRVPRESINAPRAVRAGGWKLPVWDEPRLHTKRLWATCRVWINCESKGRRTDGGRGKPKRQKEKRGENWNHPTEKKNQLHPTF